MLSPFDWNREDEIPFLTCQGSDPRRRPRGIGEAEDGGREVFAERLMTLAERLLVERQEAGAQMISQIPVRYDFLVTPPPPFLP